MKVCYACDARTWRTNSVGLCADCERAADAEYERLSVLTKEQLDAELVAAGLNPEDVAQRAGDMVRRLLAERGLRREE